MIRGAGALVLVFVATVARRAEAEPDQLRLTEVIAVAVRSSPELARARIDVETARGQLLQAQGIEDAHVGVTGTATVTRPPPGDPYGNQQNVRVQVLASQPLSTGGTVNVEVSGSRTQFGGGSTVDDNGQQQATNGSLRNSGTLAIGITQPLLRGAGSTVFEAPIRQAAQLRDAAALTREARARDLVVSLSQAYWQVAFAWRQLEVRKASLELAQQQLTYTEGAIRAEKVSRSEALAVQEAIATRKQDILAAEQDVYERSLALRQLGGLEIGPEAIAVTTEPLPDKIDASAPEVAAVIAQVFEHSAELAALAAARRAAELGVTLANDAARSQLDASVSAGPQIGGRTIADALSNGLSSPGIEIGASLTFDHAIGGHVERGGQAVAQAALLAAKVAERDARGRVAVRATRAVQRLKAALASIALGTEAIGLAEQNVTAEQKRFDLGKSTNNEVLRRQDELQQARLRHASAVADYLAARAELDGVSGVILARYNIVMP